MEHELAHAHLAGRWRRAAAPQHVADAQQKLARLERLGEIIVDAGLQPLEQRIEGLETGVDDYLAKPFEPRELLLRVTTCCAAAAPSPASGEVRMGDFVFHVARGELKRERRDHRLTERERELLRYFAQRPGMPVSRHELAKGADGGGERAVDVQINRLQAQDRARSCQPGLSPDGARQGLHSLSRVMDATPNPDTRSAPERARPLQRLLAAFGARMPKGLYARALIIIIAPMVLLQSVLTFVFLERHWQTVTRRLSTVTVQNIAHADRPLPELTRRRPRRSPLMRSAEQNLGHAGSASCPARSCLQPRQAVLRSARLDALRRD